MSILNLNIDRSSPVPIYYQLKQEIENLIETGELSPGDTLPSENEFSKAYSISPMTVRQAMSELVNDGYIHRERGRGTFVSSRRLAHTLDRLMSFSEDMQNRDLTPSSQILIFEETPPPMKVMRHANLSSSDRLLRIRRLRLADKQPVGLHDTYLHGVTFSQEELETTQSLYRILENRGIQLAEGVKTIEAVAAEEDIAALLGLQPGSPLLQTTQFSWDHMGNFVEFVIAHYHSDLYQYTIQLRR